MMLMRTGMIKLMIMILMMLTVIMIIIKMIIIDEAEDGLFYVLVAS